MKVNFKKLDKAAVIPKYAKSGDAGLDLTAISKKMTMDKNGMVYTYGTGLAIEIPENHVGLIFPRSSIFKTTMSLANSVGVIDSGYRGEIMFKMRVPPGLVTGKIYDIGDRVGQLIILPIPNIEVNEVDDLNDNTDRGKGGFGHTGE